MDDEEIEEVDDAAALALGVDDEHAGTVQAVAKLAEGEQVRASVLSISSSLSLSFRKSGVLAFQCSGVCVICSVASGDG